MRRPALAALMAAALFGCEARPQVPFGFAPGSARAQLALERSLTTRASSDRIRALHRELTAQPHPAGSARSRAVAERIAAHYRAAGLEDVRLTPYDVLVPEPREISVEFTGAESWRALSREPSSPEMTRDTDVPLAYHAFSASGSVTAPLVFAGAGTPENYEWLRRSGVDVRGRIVLVQSSGSYSYRGLAAFTAQTAGAAGILVSREPPVSSPPSLPPADLLLERGSILYDFIVPGDPLTPGWPSTRGARRIEASAAASMPAILSVPISARDARRALQALPGPTAPSWWGTSSGAPRQVGPGPGVRMRVAMDSALRTIWVVTGAIRGRENPDHLVILGNHHDSWVYGGVDPGTGTAALMELATLIGSLTADGWRPRRTLLFASWDGEELGLTGSTEWVEQHEVLLQNAVAYLNVDSAASGTRFTAGAVPSLLRVLAGAAGAVRDPLGRTSVGEAARGRLAQERGADARGEDDEVIESRLGGGSDYVPFVFRAGVPSAQLGFQGPFVAYHSASDTHAYVDRTADPGFRYTTALTAIAGIAGLRLADAETIPLDPSATASAVRRFVQELTARADSAHRAHLQRVEEAAGRLETAARRFAAERETALRSGVPAWHAVNTRLIRFERAFLDAEGLRGREWYKHLVHAPSASYAPEVLPGLRAGLESGRPGLTALEAERVCAALARAAAVLDDGTR